MDFDPETLLYLEGGRPYDPAAGRYLTAGSMASGTYNIYAFANNTPVDRSVRDVRGAGMQGIVGGSPIGAAIRAMVDGVVDSIWSTINSFKDGAIAAGEHIRDSWYELSDDNWDAFQSRQSDFFRSWVSRSTFQQALEVLWLKEKHGPVTTFATPPSWLESERAAFKTYFETSNGTTSWGYGERFAPLGDEIIVTVVSSVTGRLIPPGAATLARSSRFLIKHLDDVIDVGVDGGRVISRGSNAPRKAVTGMDNRGFSSLAEQKYDAIRSLRMSDVENVATNTGLTVSEVTTMKKHLFFGKHQRFAPEVGGVVRKRFDANDDIAEAWLKAQNRPLDARQQQWFRQIRDHELGERSLMGSGVPFQDVSAWQRINGQWEHVYREGLRGAHELAPRPPKFWPFFE
ncbi:MAG: hypothetical protein FJ308_23155 [Planctomycetes bacterium]|nr:hypothetical protein [Planctomycetota bacterium]